MPNNYLSVLYKHIIQVKNENVGQKVGGGTNIPLPPQAKKWGGTCPPCPPASYASVYRERDYYQSVFVYRQYHVLGIKIVLCEPLLSDFQST